MDVPNRQQQERAIWDGAAKTYDRNVMGTFREAYQKTIAAINQSLTPQSRVLEIGCGTGIIALGIAPHAGEVIGVDLSPKMIAIAQEKVRKNDLDTVRFQVGDAYDLPFPPGAFDAVLLTNMLHFVKEPKTVLQEAHRLLKPGGLLATVTDCYREPVPLVIRLKLMVPRLMKLLGKIKYLHYYRKTDLLRLLEAARFEITSESVLHPAPVNYYISGRKN
jgi:ubiquinone/menaquinone biosynthesis C-methylase UbiE